MAAVSTMLRTINRLTALSYNIENIIINIYFTMIDVARATNSEKNTTNRRKNASDKIFFLTKQQTKQCLCIDTQLCEQ
jgi:archaellum biogenesis ATPase FlaH